MYELPIGKQHFAFTQMCIFMGVFRVLWWCCLRAPRFCKFCVLGLSMLTLFSWWQQEGDVYVGGGLICCVHQVVCGRERLWLVRISMFSAFHTLYPHPSGACGQHVLSYACINDVGEVEERAHRKKTSWSQKYAHSTRSRSWWPPSRHTWGSFMDATWSMPFTCFLIICPDD